jgi:hypothetical protein
MHTSYVIRDVLVVNTYLRARTDEYLSFFRLANADLDCICNTLKMCKYILTLVVYI